MTAYYCNKECQKADWKNHKKSCKARSAGSGRSPFSDVVSYYCEPDLRSTQGSNENVQRIPGIIELGPVTTVGELMAAKPGDPKPKFEERLYKPTVEQVYELCVAKMKEVEAADPQGEKKALPMNFR